MLRLDKYIFLGLLFLTGCGDKLSLTVDDVTLLTASLTHGGWEDIVSLGAKVQSTTTGTTETVSEEGFVASKCSGTSHCIRLQWGDFTSGNNTVLGYNIYRSTTSGGQDFGAPLNTTTISTNDNFYIDTSSLVSGTTYYYVVRAIINSAAIPNPDISYKEIRVISPPNNMALVHRWIANKEVCESMNLLPDASDNYTCAYDGTGNTNNRYDLGHDLLVDRFESGCNFTKGTACSSGTAECISDSNPSDINDGADGDVYYSRQNGRCWLKIAGSWTPMASITTQDDTTGILNTAGTAGTGLGSTIASPLASLPPLTSVDQQRAYLACQSQPGQSINGSTLYKRLLRRKEFIASARWDESITTDVNATEDGTDSTEVCNTNARATQADDPPTLTDNSFPNDDTAGTNLYITGSDGASSTRDCVSNFGIQDMIGNAWEWNSDMISIGVGITSTIDTSNDHLNGFNFVGNAQGPSAGSQEFSAYNYFNIALGLPLRCFPTTSCTTDELNMVAVDTSDSATSSPAQKDTNDDYFWLDNTLTRGLLSGGSEFNGGLNDEFNGRYSLNLEELSTASNDRVGFRCAIQVDY